MRAQWEFGIVSVSANPQFCFMLQIAKAAQLLNPHWTRALSITQGCAKIRSSPGLGRGGWCAVLISCYSEYLLMDWLCERWKMWSIKTDYEESDSPCCWFYCVLVYWLKPFCVGISGNITKSDALKEWGSNVELLKEKLPPFTAVCIFGVTYWRQRKGSIKF